MPPIDSNLDLRTIKSVKQIAPSAEQRTLGRLDVRIGEGISVALTRLSTGQSYEFRVMDFSSIGIGVESLPEDSRELSPEDFHDGETLHVNFRLSNRNDSDHRYEFPCRVQYVLLQVNGRIRMGLERIDVEELRNRFSDGRMFTIPDTVLLRGLIDHPFLYDQTSIIEVRRISRKSIIVVNRDRHFAVFPSVPVIFSLNIFSGREPINGHVSWVRPLNENGQGGGLEFAIEIDFMSDATDQGLVRYLMRLTRSQPLDLRKAGFDTRKIKNIISYRFLKTQQEYIEVLKLRREAYASVRKLARDADLVSVSYENDEYSRILTAWHENRLVGSVNISFADGVKVPFEFQKYISESDFAKLPSPDQIIEVTGLCTHHGYRKTDVLVGMFERMFQVMVTSGRSFFVAASDKYLWRVYETIGFKKTGIKYTVKKLHDLELDVITVNRRVGAYGWEMDPMRWDELYHQISDHLDMRGVLPKSARHRVVSPVYKMYIDIIKGLQESKMPGADIMRNLLLNNQETRDE